MITVLLVDDHPMVRSGLQRLLEQAGDIEVVGVADRGEEAVSLDCELRPDVILMDISMPGLGGIETTRRILTDRPDACVVMLTAHTDRHQVVKALDAGAVGYLVKDSEPAMLIDGVHAAAAGDSPLDPRAGRALLESRRQPTPNLTSRETEVLRLIARGLTNSAIARQLAISEKTVKSHLTRVFANLGVSDRTQAAIWAKDHLDIGTEDG